MNQWLRQKQSAREVTQAVHERLRPLSAMALQQITAPAVIPAAAPAPSALQESISSATFRRIARPRGPLARRATGATATPDGTGPGGGGAILNLRDHLASVLQEAATGQFELTPAAGHFAGAASIAGRRPQPTGGAPRVAPEAVRSVATIDSTAKAALLDNLAPSRMFALEAQARVAAPSGLTGTTNPSDPLAPMSFPPKFAQPMSEPLEELFQDMFLPGLDRVPQNCVTMLLPDSAFIEAYMLGLNHEMSREFLWREFPTDLRGTYFRQFWDVRGQLASEATEPQREALCDVPPITEWRKDLGEEHGRRPGSESGDAVDQGRYLPALSKYPDLRRTGEVVHRLVRSGRCGGRRSTGA